MKKWALSYSPSQSANFKTFWMAFASVSKALKCEYLETTNSTYRASS